MFAKLIEDLKNVAGRPDERRMDFARQLLQTEEWKRKGFEFPLVSMDSPQSSKEDWHIDFIPWVVLEVVNQRRTLRRLIEESEEREFDASYLEHAEKECEELLASLTARFTKFGYPDIPCCILIYGGTVNDKFPIILDAEPRELLNLIELYLDRQSKSAKTGA